MNPKSLSPASGFARVAVSLSALLLLIVVNASPAFSQSDRNNNDYTKRIREYTTEPYFMTELVDHLPLSDKVPSPDKVLGYVVGTPNKLTYTKDLYRYYRELAKSSPRVRIFTAPESSEEGREQLLVAVGDEATLAKLDRYKDITAQLADPVASQRHRSTKPDH